MRYTHLGVGHSTTLRRIARDCFGSQSATQADAMDVVNGEKDADGEEGSDDEGSEGCVDHDHGDGEGFEGFDEEGDDGDEECVEYDSESSPSDEEQDEGDGEESGEEHEFDELSF
jgi:hypothetical protein